jgi:hypothetical protein
MQCSVLADQCSEAGFLNPKKQFLYEKFFSFEISVMGMSPATLTEHQSFKQLPDFFIFVEFAFQSSSPEFRSETALALA